MHDQTLKSILENLEMDIKKFKGEHSIVCPEQKESEWYVSPFDQVWRVFKSIHPFSRCTRENYTQFSMLPYSMIHRVFCEKKSSLKPNTKETLLSEEVIIPVAFWDGAPKHHITCITKQTSRRRGDVILTGSNHGETIVWKPEGIPHGRGKAEKFPISSSGPYVTSCVFLIRSLW